MSAQKNPWKVTQEKDCDDTHENHGQIVFHSPTIDVGTPLVAAQTEKEAPNA